MQRRAFGLTPEDRKRLQWEIARPDEGSATGGDAAPGRRARGAKEADPREALRAVGWMAL
jgi:hypothetical protein